VVTIVPVDRRRRLRYEQRILLGALGAGAPAVVVALSLLWWGEHSAKVLWTLTLFIVGFWLGGAMALRERAMRPLQTLSNLLAALREEDFSLRARGARLDDALGLAMLEANALGETLRSQRLGALEATALLRTVMAEIDVAIFAFDETRRLRLVNREGERLLGAPAERLMGREAGELRLDEFLRGDSRRTVTLAFAGGQGRWELRRRPFRQGGISHELVVLADLSRTLREEERQAWQRLVRVLSHEINNSLAPIKSIAGSLRDILVRRTTARAAVRVDGGRDEDVEDFSSGLAVIAGRSEALSRFVASYARLTRLPPPRLAPLDVGEWVHRVVELETRIDVDVEPGAATSIRADGDQLDQLLINLVHNAADAALETGGGVRVRWRREDGALVVLVEDEGPGLHDTSNLFVPFFTTKPNGSGIGLALSRQIAEAHGGTLTLANRVGARGCVARLELPAEPKAGAA
jgi:two-component system, NtrC family, nitrogen regulation sensor histidine kinase NtrY